MALEWLIVGAGMHGVHLACSLLGGAKVPRDRLRLLDPHGFPLARWQQLSTTVGMRFMRSPSVHHLDGPPFSLANFAREQGYSAKRDFQAPYNRPSLSLFNAYTEALLEGTEMAELCVLGRALDLVELEDGLEVVTESARIHARRVVLALGSDRLMRPDWTEELELLGLRVSHLFDEDFEAQELDGVGRLVIVGGGISAAQFAVARSRAGHESVTLLTREPLREAQFDSEPGWLGPLHLESFRRERDLTRRRAMISQARNRGTVPRQIMRELRQQERRGRLEVRTGEVVGAKVDRHGFVELWSSTGLLTRAGRVVLATGLARERPGAWLDGVSERLELPLSTCGYPIVDRALRWHPRIHVSGALAELELGPAARNIAGARMASERLLEHLCGPRPPARARVVRLGSI